MAVEEQTGFDVNDDVDGQVRVFDWTNRSAEYVLRPGRRRSKKITKISAKMPPHCLPSRTRKQKRRTREQRSCKVSIIPSFTYPTRLAIIDCYIFRMTTLQNLPKALFQSHLTPNPTTDGSRRSKSKA